MSQTDSRLALLALLFLLLSGPLSVLATAAETTPVPSRALTYYIDSVAGQNTGSGTSPQAAWKDFTNITGKTLAAGEKLLIKRGSVINQELQVSAQGTAENWAEIGVYGDGPRPIIQRNWHIDDRCVLVRDPDYLRIRGLVVSYAAKGLVVTYTRPGHAGLLIEDCIAHHIEGMYRPNSSGIPEWRDHSGPQGDVLTASAGIAVTGASARDITIRDCDLFQASWGFFVKGEKLTLDRVFCHHCYACNTSPHPALVATRDAVMQNCIFDASGGHAFAGTMGIMIVDPQGLIIRNCTFRNLPDSGSHDEGGIDFEARGDGCLIDRCTFENNAGAAVEVLGLRSPQPQNVEIRNSRFIKNNWAQKLGPAEIYIWGKARPQDPNVCCSTGAIHGNGYVLLPGVEFFVNEAPTLTQWTLHDNTQYSSVEELDKAMPHNNPPSVEAGPVLHADTLTVSLAGTVADDNRPADRGLKVRWELLEGPGGVTFEDSASAATRATFDAPGDYLLRLLGDDGELWTSDTVAVHVLPRGQSVVKSWEFNTNLNKEGWTEVNPGTREREEKHPQWPCKSLPVKYVSGGYYIVAVEDSPDAHLLSADNLNVDISAHRAIRIRFMNHTPATRMRLRFTTAADSTWDDANRREFDVVPNDSQPREYVIDMSELLGWTGRLKQLRLDLATGSPLTGTCRVDYISIVNAAPAP